MRIGVFDSGIGGVNVLSCLIKKYPNNQYIYYGDTLNLPYGEKTKEELLKLSSNAIEFLLSKKVDIIVIACGTISSNCYCELKNKYKVPLYDIISPTIRYLKNSKYHNIGVIGTKRTIESKIFDIDNKNIFMMATPSFVPIIENNVIEENKREIIDTLRVFEKSDLLVLGCTHYPLLANSIEKEMNIQTLDMGEILAQNLNITNNDVASCELYFSQLGVNLVVNVENILHGNYQIYLK